MNKPDSKREWEFRSIETKWANKAFQLKGSQTDYNKVMKKPYNQREFQFRLIENEWADKAY